MSSEQRSAALRAGTDAGNPAPLRSAEMHPSSANPLVPEGVGRGDKEHREPDRRRLIEVAVDLREGGLDPEYWLGHSHGFLVDSDSGEEVGVVEDVELAPDGSGTIALVVASGWFGRHVQTIPVADVLAIVPNERRLIVKEAAARSQT